MSLMGPPRAWFSRLFALFRKRERDTEFPAELESHRELHFETILARA